MNRSIKYIKKRLEYLKGTSKELKGYYKKSKVGLIQELALEIDCYINQINDELKNMKGGLK